MKTTGYNQSVSRIARSMRAARHLIQALPVLLLLVGLGATPALSRSDEEPEAEAKKTEIPKTLPGVWSAILADQRTLHETLAAKDLEKVHHIAFSIRDYVTALPSKSKLSNMNKKSLKHSVAYVDTLAVELDDAGDAGDSSAVAALVTKLDAQLQSIEALYPPKDLMPAVGTSVTSKQMYACPMHPEVTSDKPGKCSKCGMNLVMKAH